MRIICARQQRKGQCQMTTRETQTPRRESRISKAARPCCLFAAAVLSSAAFAAAWTFTSGELIPLATRSGFSRIAKDYVTVNTLSNETFSTQTSDNNMYSRVSMVQGSFVAINIELSAPARQAANIQNQAAKPSRRQPMARRLRWRWRLIGRIASCVSSRSKRPMSHRRRRDKVAVSACILARFLV